MSRRGGQWPAWTRRELALVRKHYPHGGPDAVQAAGVDRTTHAIYFRARALGLIRPRGERPPLPSREAPEHRTWRDELEDLAESNPTPTEYKQQAARIHAARRRHTTRIEEARLQRIAGNRT